MALNRRIGRTLMMVSLLSHRYLCTSDQPQGALTCADMIRGFFNLFASSGTPPAKVRMERFVDSEQFPRTECRKGCPRGRERVNRRLRRRIGDQRGKHVDDIKKAIMYRWGGVVHWVPGDGNCMVHAFCLHLEERVSAECAQRERNLIVDHTLENPVAFPKVYLALDDSLNSFDGYRRNGEWLQGYHAKAWHLKHKVNVIFFMAYPGDSNVIGVRKYWKREWEVRPACGIMHENGEHYWYVQLPRNDQLKQLPYFDADDVGYNHIDIAQSIKESALERKG